MNKKILNLIMCGIFFLCLNAFSEDEDNPAKELLEKKEYIKYYNKVTDNLVKLGQTFIDDNSANVESISYEGLSDSSGAVTEGAAESTSENLFGIEVNSNLSKVFDSSYKEVIAEVISKVLPDEFGGITSEGVAFLCGLLTAESAEAIASSFDIVANLVIFIVMIDPGEFEAGNYNYSSKFQLKTKITNNDSTYPLILEHFNISASNKSLNKKDIKKDTKKYLYASNYLAPGHISKTAHNCSFSAKSGGMETLFKPGAIPTLIRPLINNVALPATMLTQFFGYNSHLGTDDDSGTYSWKVLAFGGIKPYNEEEKNNQICFVSSQWNYPPPSEACLPKYYQNIPINVPFVELTGTGDTPTLELDYSINVIDANAYMWQLVFHNNDPNYFYQYNVYTENEPDLNTISGVGLFTPNFFTQTPPNCFEFEVAPQNYAGDVSPDIQQSDYDYGIINIGWVTTKALTVNDNVNTINIKFTAYDNTGLENPYGSFVLPLKIITKKTGGFLGIGQTIQPFIEPQPIQISYFNNVFSTRPKNILNPSVILGKSKNNIRAQGLDIEDYNQQESYKDNPINLTLSSTLNCGAAEFF